MNRLLRSLIDGAIGGVAGTIAMSAVVAAARALGGAEPRLPRRAVGKALALAHLDRHDLAAVVGGPQGVGEHLGVGLGLGAAFGGLAYALRGSKLPTPIQGALFGGAVFVVHRFLDVPAPSFLDPDDVRAPMPMPLSLAAHVAFGAALGITVARLAPAEEDEASAKETTPSESATAADTLASPAEE